MAEMTPEEQVFAEAISKSLGRWPNDELSDAIKEFRRTAVQAERERIAKAHMARAIELENIAKKTSPEPVAFVPEANWHRQQAAALRQDPA